MRKICSLSTGLILLAFYSNGQTNPFNSNQEIVSERGMYSKVFLKPNGDHEAVISASPVHYKKNGTWEEINTTVVTGLSDHRNESNVIRSYFPNTNDSSGKIKLIVNAGDEILIRSEKELMTFDDQLVPVSGPVNSNVSSAIVTGNMIRYENIFADITDEFTIRNGEIKNNFLLNNPPVLLQSVSSGYFGFRETMELPEGWKIVSPGNSSLTASPLQIVDPQNNPVLMIPDPVFFDNYGQSSDGSHMVEGKYLISHDGNNWSITTLVPVAWLKDSNTNYPVSLDPTVIIVGTTGGWQSPNNFVDNPSFVFIGVCCGNLTHRAWIKFNISGIPTTSCITNVEIQPNVTSVANTTAEGVLINDVTGAFGPYGGINAGAYNDFGTGNYTSFTITGTGLYGYYSLGASANTLLQSQIPGGWFQTAFQFVNEPSVNYKIITATSSNLRVTYAAPPCAVLPIELLSFDAKCNKGKVDLSWQTASQINNDHFTIERTSDGINYETIGTVAGAGNSNEILNYSFVDQKPIRGTSYYALKQTDHNGHSENLKLVAVDCDIMREFIIRPNPGTGMFVLEGAGENEDVIITDVFGQVIFRSKVSEVKTGIDLRDHLNGIYFVKVVSESATSTKKIILNK